MTNLRKNYRGFAVVEFSILIVIVVIIGLVAYKVSNKNTATNTPQAANTETALPSKINSKEDVSKTIDAVDSTPINDKLNPNQLDGNLNSIL